MHLAIQALDIAIVLIVLVSAGLGTYRGLVSESLSIIAWVAAAYATLAFGPWCAWWMQDIVSPHWLGVAAGYAVVFLVVLVPLQFATSRISQNVKKSQVGTLDSVLGAGFGVLRAAVILGIAYLLLLSWQPYPREWPVWVREARLLPAVRASAQMVASVVPNRNIKVGGEDEDEDSPEARPDDPIVDLMHGESPSRRDQGASRSRDPIVQKMEEADGSRRRSQTTVKHKKAHNEPVSEDESALPQKSTQKTTKRADKAYGAKDRQALDRLIETSSSDKSGKP